MVIKKTHWMTLRIALDEKQALHNLAKSHGVTLSSFIRALPSKFEQQKTA